MSEIFIKKELKQPGFFQRLFKIKPKENSIIEINNLLSEKGVLDIKKEEIELISNSHKVDLQKMYSEGLFDFYKKHLEYSLRNNELTENDLHESRHLEDILELNKYETGKIFDTLTRDIYKSEVEKSISGGILERKDEEKLLAMQKNLLIPKDIATNIYTESAESIIKSGLEKAIADQRFSPEEEDRLNVLAKDLHINLSFEQSTRDLLDKFKLFWQIDTGDIPIVVPDISLQKGELCYFFADINWLEKRSVTTRVNYGGPSYRVKIVKGLYYRVGSVSAQRVTEDIWKTIDSGKLYLTSKRIIFMGSRGNKTISINKILDFNVYTNGIDIQKDTGKSPFFEFDTDTDVFAVILAKLLMEKQAG